MYMLSMKYNVLRDGDLCFSHACMCNVLQIWLHIEKLDAEVFSGNVHPLFLKASLLWFAWATHWGVIELNFVPSSALTLSFPLLYTSNLLMYMNEKVEVGVS